jgi:hypothetical protein
MIGIISAVKRCDGCCLKSVGVRHAGTVLRSKRGMLRKETEANEQVRLAAPHRLLQMEDGLGGSPCKPCDALGDQVFHALSDMGFVEES